MRLSNGALDVGASCLRCAANSSFDRTLKRELYESLSVPAYWMVDPQAPSILALRLADGRYETEAEVAGGTFATTWPFPLSIALDDLLRQPASVGSPPSTS